MSHSWDLSKDWIKQLTLGLSSRNQSSADCRPTPVATRAVLVEEHSKISQWEDNWSKYKHGSICQKSFIGAEGLLRWFGSACANYIQNSALHNFILQFALYEDITKSQKGGLISSQVYETVFWGPISSIFEVAIRSPFHGDRHVQNLAVETFPNC